MRFCLGALFSSSALASQVSFSSSNKPHRSAPVFSPAFFNIFDADGDEMLTFRELTDGFTKEGMFEGQVVEQADTFFEVYDHNEDGRVDFHEFGGAWNKDGAPRVGGKGAGAKRVRSPKQRLRTSLLKFYARHNADKMKPAVFNPILDYFVGREELLNKNLRDAYGVDLLTYVPPPEEGEEGEAGAQAEGGGAGAGGGEQVQAAKPGDTRQRDAGGDGDGKEAGAAAGGAAAGGGAAQGDSACAAAAAGKDEL
jgi:hypothetical protein